MRSIKNLHNATFSPIGDLDTYRAMPTSSIDHLDPFLFLNHHGPQVYRPNNNGLPFGPHPHRGFETLTYIFKGDIVHWDSSGAKSIIKEGGIQWMTAGSGLIHSEVSSEEFKKTGGEEEVLQLWLNLPSKYKMTPPKYIGATKDEIPQIKEDGSKVVVSLVSGNWGESTGPVDSLTGLRMTSINMKPEGKLNIDIPEDHQILFYVVKGSVSVNGQTAKTHQLVEFELEAGNVEIIADGDSVLIFGHGKPFNEPIVAHGPFVMNSRQEIQQAFEDYQSGKMGSWKG